MSFYIYRNRNSYNLTDGTDIAMTFATEAEAINAAVRMAQDADELYTINYHRPA